MWTCIELALGSNPLSRLKSPARNQIRRFTPRWHTGALGLVLCSLWIHSAFAQPDVRPGYLYVEFVEQRVQTAWSKTGFAVFDEAAGRYGVESIEKAFPFLDAIAAQRTLTPEAESLRYVYKVKYSSPFTPDLVAEELSQDPAVVLAEPLPVYRITGALPAIPNDARYHRQNHLDWLQLPQAWDVVKGQQAEVLIAIVDTGTHWQHDDLRANLWTNPNEIPNNGIDDDSNGFVDDVHGWNFRINGPDAYGDGTRASHGTAVSGVANAATDNAIGIAGAAWNAKFVPINTTCKNSDQLCFADEGVLYAAMLGADIINASFVSPIASDVARRVYEAVFAEGALAIAAAGNDGTNNDYSPHYPSGYAVNLSVGGTSKSSDQNVFNYGRSVNVFAPGENIDAPMPGNHYGQKHGTSFAAPLASGVAALVKTAFPHFTPGQLRAQIRMTAESIDDAQSPPQPGLYGRGRINAFRAVTEEVGWAIRLTDYTYGNQDGNDNIVTGDSVAILATFRNIHGNASNVSIRLRSSDSFVRVHSEAVTGVSLAKGDDVTLEFQFELTAGAPNNRKAVLHFEIDDGTITDSPDLVYVKINQTQLALHQTAALRVSVTSEGNIGYTTSKGDIGAQGIGVRPVDRQGNERNPLYEGGLVIGRSATQVSDCVRGTELGTDRLKQQEDFHLVGGESLEFFEPGELTSQRGRVLIADTLGAGVRILQESYTDNAAGNEDFIIFKYTVWTTLSRSYENLHVGLFFDWDVDLNHMSRDQARFNSVLGTGWVTDEAGSLHVGTLLLTHKDKLHYRAIHNFDELYGGYTDDEKWQHLSGGVTRVTLGRTDVSQMTGVGPLAIGPNESVEVAFAVIAGKSESDYLENAKKAQVMWANIISAPRTAIEPPEMHHEWNFRAVYPNPTSGPVTIEFTSPAGRDMVLDVHDVLGRKVATLFTGQADTPLHRLQWDPRDTNGKALAGGVYLVRLMARSQGQTRRRTYSLVLVR